MQKREWIDTHAHFLSYWQTQSTVPCHRLADIFLSGTSLVRETGSPAVQLTTISIQSGTEPNQRKFSMFQVFQRKLVLEAAWLVQCGVTAHSLPALAKNEGLLHRCAGVSKYLSFLTTEELLEATELYFISKIIIYAWKKEQEAQIQVQCYLSAQAAQLTVWFRIPYLEADMGHSILSSSCWVFKCFSSLLVFFISTSQKQLKICPFSAI